MKVSNFKLFIMGLIIAFNHLVSSGQNLKLPFKQLVLKVDTLQFSTINHLVNFNKEPHLMFRYFQEDQIAEINIYPDDRAIKEYRKMSIDPNPDFDILDSIVFVNNSFLRFRVRFKSLSKSAFHHFTFRIGEKNDAYLLRLFPYTFTEVNIYGTGDDIYIGEEKSFEVITNNPQNLVIDGKWNTHGNLDYRLIERGGQILLSVIPNAVGNLELDLKINTLRPFIEESGKITQSIQIPRIKFNVKGSRLSFLRIDQREIIKERNNRNGVEVQIDNHRNLQINKTYRIEDTEEKGGPLMAELHTVRRLSNDKILCILRPYELHNSSNGYLFIKDGDVPMFITNLEILPDASISRMSILREGKNWTQTTSVMPGETIEVRFEGEGLSRANFVFDGLEDISTDTLIRNDKSVNYLLRVPVNIRKRNIEIYNKGRKTNFSLNVVEHKKPRHFDFVKIDIGNGAKPLSSILQPILHKGTVKDITFSFDDNLIDKGDVLHGKQIIEIDIRITGSRGELIEMQKVERLDICPGEMSPRHAFYADNSCLKQDFRLNSVLSRKTHSLDQWSKIELTVRHKNSEYETQGYVQRIEIYLQRTTTFDIDLSFPAGLVIKRVGVEGFPGLGGISLAMIAQFSFYAKDEIQRLKPYKIGAGFLAQNAFNFNPNVEDRDLGIVILGSLYPSRRDRRLSFPLYGGFGYFLNESRFFYLIGPGIRVSF